MLKMLVVDDQDMERDGIRFLVEMFDLPLRLFEASDGEKALEVLRREQNIDILFSDIKMPHMDGLQLCTNARALYPGLHIVICSAYGEFEYARKALSLRASSYLLRPVHVEEFHKTMLSVIEACERERALAEHAGALAETCAQDGFPDMLSDMVHHMAAQARAPHQKDAFVDEVRRYLHTHYRENIGVTDIARAAHVSVGHLCREFKKETGISLMQYLQQYRLEKAKALLRNSHEKVHDIALRTGFQSAAYFGAVFKREMRMTPNAYRNGEEQEPDDDDQQRPLAGKV